MLHIYKEVAKKIDTLRNEGLHIHIREHKEPILISLKNREFETERIPTFFYILFFLHEDDLFPSHRGFNIDEIRRALFDTIFQHNFRGGSSISQQTAKNIFTSGERTFRRKLTEFIATICLEKTLSKEEILYLYLACLKFAAPIAGLQNIIKLFKIPSLENLDIETSEVILSTITTPTRKIRELKQGGITAYNYNYSYEKLLSLSKILHRTKITLEDKGISKHKTLITKTIKEYRDNPSLNLSLEEEKDCIKEVIQILNKLPNSLNHIILTPYPGA